VIEEVPLVVRCTKCNRDNRPNRFSTFALRVWPPTDEVVSGRELEVAALEISDDPANASGEVRQKVLKQNDVVARALRSGFHDAASMSSVSSPAGRRKDRIPGGNARTIAQSASGRGSGRRLGHGKHAQRLARAARPFARSSQAPFVISKPRWCEPQWKGGCYRIWISSSSKTSAIWFARQLRSGEDLRAVLLSTTEGEDKPLKYPTISTPPTSRSSQNVI